MFSFIPRSATVNKSFLLKNHNAVSKAYLPSTKLVLAQASKKQNYANPDSILIDDRVSNIDQWVKAGGIGILHTDTVSTINKLKELGL